MKEVIVLGGGFAGVSTALHLLKKLSKGEGNITLIDKNSYHLFTSSLYEVATSEEPKKNIAIPYSEIFKQNLKIVKGNVVNIDTQGHRVTLDNQTNYFYDYLIIALGSESEFFGIDGLKKYSLPLKTLEDGAKIKKTIEKSYHYKVRKGKKLNIVVGGGGFSGTEFTAELINYRKYLSKHHKISKDLVNIIILQGSNKLLKDLDEKVSQIAHKRLEDGNVKICLSSRVKKVDEKNIETDDGKKYPYDVFVWTGGVRASGVLAQSGFKTNGKGHLSVNDNMQVLGFNNIFAVGDVAEVANPVNNKPAPGVAEVAEDEGRIAAENVYRSLKDMELVSYKYLHVGYIVPLKGKFAVCDLKKIRIIGFFGWVLQQLVFLYYLLRILPPIKALKRWNKFEMYLVENS